MLLGKVDGYYGWYDGATSDGGGITKGWSLALLGTAWGFQGW